MSETNTGAVNMNRKTRQRRNGMEQAQDIEKALRRARTTFITEDNEKMAEAMHEMQKDLASKL